MPPGWAGGGKTPSRTHPLSLRPPSYLFICRTNVLYLPAPLGRYIYRTRGIRKTLPYRIFLMTCFTARFTLLNWTRSRYRYAKKSYVKKKKAVPIGDMIRHYGHVQCIRFRYRLKLLAVYCTRSVIRTRYRMFTSR